MLAIKTRIIFGVAYLLFSGLASTAWAQSVDVQLSTREAFVGMPIVLQVSIENAADYERPEIPRIDGCNVQASGSPSQSSQITIINGRRTESRSVAFRYLITPRREGTFEIPPFKVKIDGRERRTQALRFVATKSQTGDLLFVEIEGGQEKVFVGQPLDLKLKIWIKPFVDREKQLKLSESDMWRMVSDQTSWGSFAERLDEMAQNNRRPGGQEVLRDNGDGEEREYYLYEIDATVYPTRPGEIDADDVQIVVDYPTALGKSRDPFDEFFKDSPFGRDPFGGSSTLSRMMNDDLFESPFRNRLAVTSSRPIVGEAKVDSTQVIPIPTTGRPDDYRGAVGRYRIVTQATPTEVSAGDPITLQIGIIGTGPMELVQAPPLSRVASLTVDFKVADQSLAGFVQDETKVFPTTIRPRREGITQIPPIPFSFFDPVSEQFETVMSEAIPIKVNKSESLDLDAIVGNARGARDKKGGSSTPTTHSGIPSLGNRHDTDILVSQDPTSVLAWVGTIVFIPPIVWLMILLVRNRRTFWQSLPNFQSANRQCHSSILNAGDRTGIEQALIQYVSRRTGRPDLDHTTAIGALRSAGLYGVAGQLESFFQQGNSVGFMVDPDPKLGNQRETALELVEKLDSSFSAKAKTQVSRSAQSIMRVRPSAKRTGGVTKSIILLLVVGSQLLPFGVATAAEPMQRLDRDAIQLSPEQQQEILAEAADAYARALSIESSDSAEAYDLFATAANKYRLLVDSGIQNGGLYLNLGNTYLKMNRIGLAIVNYERARLVNPFNDQATANLAFAKSLTHFGGRSDNPATGESFSLDSLFRVARGFNQDVIKWVGLPGLIGLLGFGSFTLWGVLCLRAVGFRHVRRAWAVVPAILLSATLVSLGLVASHPITAHDAILISDTVTLREGDSEQFAEVVSMSGLEGRAVEIVDQRGPWVKLEMEDGTTGWTHQSNLESILPG